MQGWKITPYYNPKVGSLLYSKVDCFFLVGHMEKQEMEMKWKLEAESGN